MDLSVVIVNYNVEHFLEQCLHSVRRACEEINAEVFVVDNNSIDGSVDMVREKFPEVKLIANRENTGFSKANNQAIRIAKGRYVLLLNPDTLVEPDTFSKVVDFMDLHPDGGGLGVYMVDGKGQFLPESKRGLPTPMVALYKISGLASLFPKSKLFGRYHLSYLDRNETHEIDILSGAFMLMRKSTLDEVGLLDETFFMYGEDIDLSYRIQKGGYKNYYFADTKIIHYKGESTKKSSINYVFVFYRAMAIFVKKHFSPNRAQLFSFLINFAIWTRASISLFKRFMLHILTPLIDVALLYGGTLLIGQYWEEHVLLDIGHFPEEYLTVVLPLYILIWIGSIWINGGYDKPIRLLKVFRGIVTGSLAILVLYALLPETFRFSRAMIIFGTFWGILATMGWRGVLSALGVKGFKMEGETLNRVAVIGFEEEANRVIEMLQHTRINSGFTGHITLDENANRRKKTSDLGTLSQLKDIVEIYKVNELIFCGKDIPANTIINLMSSLTFKDVSYKIAPPESASIIGSNSIHTSGDLYVINVNTINDKSHRRNKFMFDISSAFVMLCCSPILILFVDQKLGFFRNIFKVLTGKYAWVGFHQTSDKNSKLPLIRPGILSPVDAFPHRNIDEHSATTLNLLYARDYTLKNDINIILKSFKNIGNSPK